jgi:hypothetical protein
MPKEKRSRYKSSYTLDFNIHENPDLFKAWFDEKSQLQIFELEGLFKFSCNDGLYTNNEEDYGQFLLREFSQSVSKGWSLKSDAYERIQSLLIKPAPNWYICIDSQGKKEAFSTAKEAERYCNSFDNIKILEKPLLPSGKYYVGDPLHIIKDKFYHLVWGSQERGVFTTADNHIFAIFRTLYGDGEYGDDQGCRYPVDSGRIGVIPFTICDHNRFKPKMGKLLNVDKPFSAEWEPQGGGDGVIVVDGFTIFIKDDLC